MTRWLADDSGASPLSPAGAALLALSLLTASVVVVVGPDSAAASEPMGVFTSPAQLKAFLERNDALEDRRRSVVYSNMAVADASTASATASGGAAADASIGSSATASDYSTTNVQVAGVDEADIVKNDDEHVYALSEGRLVIVDAFPPQDARVVSTVPLPGGSPHELYLHGDRLVVLGVPGLGAVRAGVVPTSVPGDSPPSGSPPEGSSSDGSSAAGAPTARTSTPGASLAAHSPSFSSPARGLPTRTYVRVYDVADPTMPMLMRHVEVDGRYQESRRIGDHVYAVLTSPVRTDDDGDPVVPEFVPGQDGFPDIHYVDTFDDRGYLFTNVISVNVVDDTEEVRSEAMLLGRTSERFVSTSNLYLVTPMRVHPDDLDDTLSDAARRVRAQSIEESHVHRIALDDGEMTYEASGAVPGKVLNQFSMDEHDGHLRVATTVGRVARTLSDGEPTSSNNVYVLDMDLDVVGRLEGVAPNERIYSARFQGDRGFLVTFKKVDPFFVLDLADPTSPRVLGELKLPGYSDYLHPAGPHHVIGVGKETVEAQSGDFAWFQGVKVALFDVTDVTSPRLVGSLEIGDRGTDSEVLSDHRAFLYDRGRGIAVLPVRLAEIPASELGGDGDVPANAHGDFVWQGAYVLHVTPEEGVSVHGRVTHAEDSLLHDRGHHVRRSLTMDGVLYTVSEKTLKANTLDDLTQLARVSLT